MLQALTSFNKYEIFNYHYFQQNYLWMAKKIVCSSNFILPIN